MTVDEWTQEVSAIARNKYVKPGDRLKAYDLIGKHIGAYEKKGDQADTLAKLDDILGKIEGGF